MIEDYATFLTTVVTLTYQESWSLSKSVHDPIKGEKREKQRSKCPAAVILSLNKWTVWVCRLPVSSSYKNWMCKSWSLHNCKTETVAADAGFRNGFESGKLVSLHIHEHQWKLNPRDFGFGKRRGKTYCSSSPFHPNFLLKQCVSRCQWVRDILQLQLYLMDGAPNPKTFVQDFGKNYSNVSCVFLSIATFFFS